MTTKVLVSLAALSQAIEEGSYKPLFEDLARIQQQGQPLAEGTPEPVSVPVAVGMALPRSLVDRVRDFLANDNSGYDWRSASAIAEKLGDVSQDAVREAVTGSVHFASRLSTAGKGLLVKLAA